MNKRQIFGGVIEYEQDEERLQDVDFNALKLQMAKKINSLS